MPTPEHNTKPPFNPDHDLDAADLLYEAWGVIANAPDAWREDTEWRRAATRWRDRWHEWGEG